MAFVRREWGIENGLHYRRDFGYQEDRTRMTDKKVGHGMEIINNLVIRLIDH